MFQVEFGEEVFISGVITQGVAFNIEKRVDAFTVEYTDATGGPYPLGQPSYVS